MKFTEDELREHASQLAALGMCCINRPLWEGRAGIAKYIEEHFEPKCRTSKSLSKDVSDVSDEEGLMGLKLANLL